MFVGMNRFKVRKDAVADFEAMWKNRDSFLKDVPGFEAFHLLKGPEREDYVLYVSHSMWASRGAFEAWTRSEAFRKAHARAGENKPMTLGPPELEDFDAVQVLTSARGAALAVERSENAGERVDARAPVR